MKSVFFKKQFYLYVFLICITFLGDIFRRISMYNNCSFTRYTTLSKIIFIIAALVFVIINYNFIVFNKTRKKITIIILSLIIIFLIGQFITNYKSTYLPILYNMEYLSKYLFLPFLLFVFLDLRDDRIYIKKLLFIFEIFFFINLFAILIGIIFEIEVFKTYYHGARFGYKGIYSMSGQTSIFFILLIFYYMHQLIFNGYNKWILFKCLLLAGFSILLGTKRIYFFIPILIWYYLFFLKGYKKSITLKVALIFIVISFMLINKITAVYLKTYNLFYDIYREKGFVSSFTSYRSDLLVGIIDDNSFNFWNLIFGGLNFTSGISEMGFIDLWLFFGVLGFVIYMYFYKVLFDFKSKHHFYWFFSLSLIIIVFFADAFILVANVPILLFLICSYFYLYEKEKNIGNSK